MLKKTDDVLAAYAEHFQISKKQSREAFEALEGFVAAMLKQHGGIRLVGLADLTVAEKPERTARNPQTGETVKVAAKRAIKAKVAKTLIEKIR